MNVLNITDRELDAEAYRNAHNAQYEHEVWQHKINAVILLGIVLATVICSVLYFAGI